MLEDNKQLFYSSAESNLPGWKDMTKSQLCEIYINSDEKRVKDGAISALIYKCWNIFNSNYKKQPYIPLEDWYDSMIEAIMYVLDKHVWTDPTNSLFNAPNGPEQALHRCIWSRKLNVYGANKKPKRIINLNISSTEDLKERAGLDPACEINEDIYAFNDYIKSLIQKNKIEYSIILDLIGSGVQIKKLPKEIRDINEQYIDYFYKKYSTDPILVENVVTTMQNNKQLNQYIDYYLTCLQRDEDTVNYLK